MASGSTIPDYYATLDVPATASSEQIRTAYKRQSLRSHPDRIQGDAAARRRATEEFQRVADAYYVLSDPARREAYDRIRPAPSSANSNAGAAGGAGSYFSGWFGGNTEQEQQPDAEQAFADAFEDMLRPEVQRVVPLWTWAGAGAGAVLGFIVGNLPGAALGGYGGSKLGAIRDAKGKAVYEVFKSLDGGQSACCSRPVAPRGDHYAQGRKCLNPCCSRHLDHCPFEGDRDWIHCTLCNNEREIATCSRKDFFELEMASVDWESKTVIGSRAQNKSATVARSESTVNDARRSGVAVDTDKKSSASNAAHKSTEFAKIAKLDRENEVAPPATIDKDLGKIIAKARQDLGLSQKDLGQKINEKPQIIGDYESGKAVPKQDLLGKMERALKVKLRGKNIGEPLGPPGGDKKK